MNDETTNAQPLTGIEPYTPLPNLKLYVKISPDDLEQIRAMVHEEIGNALQEWEHNLSMKMRVRNANH